VRAYVLLLLSTCLLASCASTPASEEGKQKEGFMQKLEKAFKPKNPHIDSSHMCSPAYYRHTPAGLWFP